MLVLFALGPVSSIVSLVLLFFQHSKKLKRVSIGIFATIVITSTFPIVMVNYGESGIQLAVLFGLPIALVMQFFGLLGQACLLEGKSKGPKNEAKI